MSIYSEAMEEVSSQRHPAQSLHGELHGLATRALCADVLVVDAGTLRVWASASGDGLLTDRADEPVLRGVLETLSMSRQELLDALRDLTALPSVPPPDPAEPPEPHPPDVPAPATPVSAPMHVVLASDRDAGAGERASDEPAEGEGARERGAWPLRQRALDHLRATAELAAVRLGTPLHATHAAEGMGYLARSFGRLYLTVLVFEGPFDELRAESALKRALPQIQRLVSAIASDILS